MDDLKEYKQNCLTYKYIPTKFDKVSRVIAIGDIHGDIKLAVKLLKLAEVISVNNRRVKWIGKDTYVVQTGDQLDSCKQLNNVSCYNENNRGDKNKSDIKVLLFFTKLDKLAIKHGGRVISLLGNHEINNVFGYMNYVSQDDVEYFLNLDDRRNEFKPGNKFAKILGCTRLLCVIIGNTFFSHAGLVKPFYEKINKNKSEPNEVLHKLNILIRKWLFGYELNNKDKKILKKISSDKRSIIFERALGYLKSDLPIDSIECKNEFLPIINILKLNNMIIGHTPQLFINNNTINSTCDNHLWRIDNAMSNAFDKIIDIVYENKIKKKLQILEIIDDKIFNIKSL